MLKVVFGKKFYNKFSLIEFGEKIKRYQQKRPENSLLLQRQFYKKKFLMPDNTENKVILLNPEKYFASKPFSIKKIKYNNENSSNKHFLEVFYKDYPIYTIFIGISITAAKEKARFKILCTKYPKNKFIPIIKHSKLTKLALYPENFTKEILLSNTKFSCFILSSQPPNLNIKTSKNIPINFTLQEIPDKSLSNYLIYPLSFITEYVGDYLIFSGKKLIPADFIITVESKIDPSISLLEYEKFLNIMHLKLKNLEGKPYDLSKFRNSPKDKEFFIKDQIIKISIIDNNGISQPFKTTVKFI